MTTVLRCAWYLSGVAFFAASVLFPATANAQAATAGVRPRFELFGGYSFAPETDSYLVDSEPGHGWAVGLAVNLHRHWGLAIDVDGQTWTDRGTLDSIDLSRVACAAQASGCGAIRGDERVSLSYVSVGPRARLAARRLTIFGTVALEMQRSRLSGHDLAYVGRADDQAFITHFAARPQNYFTNRPFVREPWGSPLERYGDNLAARASVGQASASAWGVGVGGGVDVALGRRVVARLVQANYSLGAFGEGPGRRLRVKAGIVFRLG